MLPSEFTEEDLFLAITGISYTGDFRMTFGENPRKIYNIVHSQMAEFREIYKPIIDDLPAVNYTAMGNIAQEDNIKIRGSMLQKLPKILQDKIHYHHRWYLNRTNQARGVATAEPHFSQSVVNSPEVGEYIRKGIAEIIRKPAIIQAVKGVLSAGIGRSVKYGLQKISKMRDGRRASWMMRRRHSPSGTDNVGGFLDFIFRSFLFL